MDTELQQALDELRRIYFPPVELDVMAGKYLDLIVKLQKENSKLKTQIKNLKKKLK
jgi:hypothetical protein